MHPYEMQRLIRQRKKDLFLDLKRGSLYHAIGRLKPAGLIDPVETTREGRRPERTTYRITDSGKEEVVTWLQELLANSARDGSHFFAALSFIGHLTPADALEQLDARAGLLNAEVAELEAVLKTLTPQIGRLVLLETEYALATRRAERDWVRTVIDDIRSGRLTWDPDVLRASACKPPEG
jgi:DNA-binding PadR family transcriptional regulator